MRDINWNVIGYRRNPEPPEPDDHEERVGRRVDEILGNADILECVLDEAGWPMNFPTTIALAEYFSTGSRASAEALATSLAGQVLAVVQLSAEHDIDNPSWEP